MPVFPDQAGAQPERAAPLARYRSMRTEDHPEILIMRRLAAEMRAHAAETNIDIYRRKFEGLASELNEAATVAEHSDGFHA